MNSISPIVLSASWIYSTALTRSSSGENTPGEPLFSTAILFNRMSLIFYLLLVFGELCYCVVSFLDDKKGLKISGQKSKIFSLSCSVVLTEIGKE